MTFGATVISVQGSYEDTFELSKQAIINPYLSEGKKTVALEIMEQLDWQVPDYIAISVGDGCTIAGLWKGLKDLHAIGFIDRLPRLISAQAEGCCPLNRAIETGEPWRPMEENTLADSIAVGVPRNADKALMAIRESNGVTVNVSDEEIMAAQKLLGRTCGVFGEPAGVTGAAGLKKLCEEGRIEPDATVVCQRHQVLRRAHLHPQRHGPAAEGLRGERHPGGINTRKRRTVRFSAVRRLFFP